MTESAKAPNATAVKSGSRSQASRSPRFLFYGTLAALETSIGLILWEVGTFLAEGFDVFLLVSGVPLLVASAIGAIWSRVHDEQAADQIARYCMWIALLPIFLIIGYQLFFVIGFLVLVLIGGYPVQA